MSMLQPSIEDFLHSCRSISQVLHLHASICQSGLEAYPSLGNQLISRLADAGNMGLAQQVFHKLVYQEDRSWNLLIMSYVKCGECERARIVYDRMHKNNCLHSSAHALVALLKACAILQDLEWGCKLHTEVAETGLLGKDDFVGTALVHMFAKCGALTRAQAIFDELSGQDVVLWNALIAGYVDQGHGEKAVQCFEQMHLLGVSFNSVTLVCCLTACGSIGNGIKGQEIHAEALKKGLEMELAVGNSLVDMYAKCGCLATAQKVFDNLSVRDAVSWNVLITGYVEPGRGKDALHSFELMQQEGISSDDVTFLCSLKACASVGVIDEGWKIHAMVVKAGLERQPLIGNTLVDMYAKCGSLATAEKVFHTLLCPDAVLWNAMVAAYADHGCTEDAIICFEKMQQEGVSSNSVTFICILKCCGSIEATWKGQEIYVEVTKQGLEKELFVGSALVDMCCKCGLLVDAWKVFGKLPVRTTVTWNTLIAGYATHGHGEEALYCLEQMRNEGVSPCAVTFVCILKACGSIGAINKHQEIHAEIVKKGLEGELLVGNALVDLYGKRGLLAESQHVFDRLSVQDVVSWSSLIGALTEQGCNEEALGYLEEMQHEGIPLNSVIYVCSLKACGSMGATVKGQELHKEIMKQGLERESLIGNILVDMYANSGWLLEAQEVFEKLPAQEVVSWNALIAGYAQLGESERVIEVFDRMLGEGFKPNHVTFLSVLNACSHAGLVDKGLLCFEAIIKDYGLLPTLKHYTCVVDVLGRAGFLNKAVALIEKIPFHPDTAVWLILLGACRKWADVKVGRHAFQHASQLDERDSAAYVCMSNIYREAAMQKEAKNVDAMRSERKAWKHSDHSWLMNFSDFILSEMKSYNEVALEKSESMKLPIHHAQ